MKGPAGKEVRKKIKALYDVYHVYSPEYFLHELETSIKAAFWLIYEKAGALEAKRIIESIRKELLGN